MSQEHEMLLLMNKEKTVLFCTLFTLLSWHIVIHSSIRALLN